MPIQLTRSALFLLVLNVFLVGLSVGNAIADLDAGRSPRWAIIVAVLATISAVVAVRDLGRRRGRTSVVPPAR